MGRLVLFQELHHACAATFRPVLAWRGNADQNLDWPFFREALGNRLAERIARRLETLPYEGLPGIALGLPSTAAIARQLRGAMINELGEDYVRNAVAGIDAVG